MIPTLAAALADQGYDTLTPVQEAVADPALDGRDLLVSAQTGSGKTVGFGLAIGPTILPDSGVFAPAAAPLAMVIAPTRELALQVKRELQWLYAHAGVTVASTVGGMDFRDERRALERGAHIVVATPGRLRDHIMRGTLDLTEIRAVVLDEADEMLDLGFQEDLTFILEATPDSRRTLLFSATVPPMIEQLARSYQKDAARISTVTKGSQHADISYLALPVAQHDAENAIINVLRFHEAPNAIVFANTRAMVTRLTTRLTNRGFATVALSGELSQQERTHALQAMRDGRARVCVATDVAARGIDLPNLDLVIHAELPTNAETLLHRSGRTGRAGRKGISAMIVPPKMRRRAENLLKWGKLTADWQAAPSAEEIRQRDEDRLLSDPLWSEAPSETETDFAAKLLARYTPDQIAAAYLRLYQTRHSAPEDLTDFDPSAPPAREPREKKDRAPFGPSRWFRLDLGRTQKAEARWLLPMICKAGDISKKEIGAIRIQPEETFVEIAEAAVPGFLAALGPDMSLENQATLSAMDGAPRISERGARPSKKMYRDTDTDQAPAPKPRKPRDTTTPAPQSAADSAPQETIPAEKPYRPASEDNRKPRAKAADTPGKPPHKGAPRDGGKPRRSTDDGATKPYRAKGNPSDKPYRAKDDGKGGKPARAKGDSAGKPYRSKDDAKTGKPFRAKDDGKGKPFRAKDGGTGKPKGGERKPAATPAKPKPNAADTSRRFVPPGGKAKPGKPRAAKTRTGGQDAPRRPKA